MRLYISFHRILVSSLFFFSVDTRDEPDSAYIQLLRKICNVRMSSELLKRERKLEEKAAQTVRFPTGTVANRCS